MIVLPSISGGLSGGGLENAIRAVFSGGVKGVWYDPSDINNYMAGLGSELVTNGDFATDTAWTKGTGITISDGQCICTSAASSSSAFYQSASVTVGKWYRYEIVVSSFTAGGNLQPKLFGMTTNLGSIGAAGTYVFYGSPTTANTNVGFGLAAITTCVIDSISIKEVTTIANATMFQDFATPVTAVEQPVGLMLDKSQGLVLGSELVTNGDFSGGTTGWTNRSTGTGTFTVSSSTASVVGIDSTNRGWFTQTMTTVSGNFYKITFDYTHTSGTVTLLFGSGTGTGMVSLTSSGTKMIYLAATSTTTYMGFQTASGGGNGVIDNVSMKELPGNHASQSGTARPFLRARYNLLTYSEQFNNGVWNLNAAVVTANQEVAPDGTTTADKIANSTTTLDYPLIYQGFTLSSAATVTKTVYAKVGSANFLSMGSYDGTVVKISGFNLSNGTVDVTAVGHTLAIVDAGGGWYRCSVTYAYPATTARTYVGVYKTSGTPQYIPSSIGADFIYIWGADARTGSSAGTYQRIAAATDYNTVGFLPYISFDGTDDSFSTNSIDFANGPTNPPLGAEQYVTGTAPWSRGFLSVDGTISATGTAVTITQGAGDSAGFRWVQPITCVVGRYYRLYAGSITKTGGTSAAISMTNSSAGTGATSDNSIIDSQDPLNKYIIATATTMYVAISLSGGVTGNSATFDNISVKEIDSAYAPDKISVFAGVTKLSDAAQVQLIETSTGASASFPGSFNLSAPGGAALTNYAFRAGGTVSIGINSGAEVFAAPITNVISMTADINADSLIGRVNGVQVNQSTSDQGTGNFGNYLMYIGRRAGTGNGFNGRLYSLIVAGKALSSGQITQLEKYVANKTGITI